MRGADWDEEDNPISLATRDNVQSCNEAYPLTVMLGNETRHIMVHLGENYNVLNGLTIDASPIDPSYKPFDIHHKGDVSLQWKIKRRDARKKGK
jgi:hypothetical protein